MAHRKRHKQSVANWIHSVLSSAAVVLTDALSASGVGSTSVSFRAKSAADFSSSLVSFVAWADMLVVKNVAQPQNESTIGS